MTIPVQDLIENIKSLNREELNIADIERLFFLNAHNDNYPDGIEIDVKGDNIKIDGKIFFMPKKQLLVLRYLLNNPHKCISRKEFLRNCWEEDVLVGDRTVDVHICKIRKILKGKINIYSHKCFGYRWKTC
jgi:hypothetical protein